MTESKSDARSLNSGRSNPSRLERWIVSWRNPGVDTAALVAGVITGATGSYWPVGVWLVTALGASFDRGWTRGR